MTGCFPTKQVNRVWDSGGDEFEAFHRALRAAGETNDERLANNSSQAAGQDGVGEPLETFRAHHLAKTG